MVVGFARCRFPIMPLDPNTKPKVRKLGFNYLIVVVLIAAASFAAWNTEKSGRRADAWLAHTLLVQKELGDMLTRFVKLESDCWAFILTGKTSFLDTQRADRESIRQSIDKLRAWTHDNEVQQDSLRRMETLSTAQMAFKDRLIAVTKEKGLDAGRAEVGTGQESNLEEMKALVAVMVAEEERLLPGRRATVLAEDRSARWLFVVLALVAVVFLTISNLRIHRMLGEAKRSAAKLKREQDNLVEAQALAKMGSWAWEVGSEVVSWSDELYHIFRLLPGDNLPTFHEYKQLFTPESATRLTRAVESAMSTGESFNLELEGVRSDGDRFVVWATGRAERDGTGTVSRLVGTAQDMTEALATLERERELVQQGKVALEAKEHFLAVMSHEIRTPINGIVGFADQLAEEHLPGEQDECVQVIQESSRSLLRIVNDILDFSAIQTGKADLTEERFSMLRLLEDLRHLLPLFGPASVAFLIEVSPTLPDQLVGDSARLRQILTNLAENALKYTREGAVTVSVKARLERGDGNTIWLECRVRDSGIGIAPEKIDLIFEPFTQAESTVRRHYGGTGLGLSISRQLVLMMGGEITVTSQPGKGSEFVVTLPMKVAQPEPLVEEINSLEPLDHDFAQRHPLSILVAEDDRVNSKVILHLLARLGYTAKHVWNGVETLEQCDLRRPDCILMDLHMPEMNGLDATRAIRSEEDRSGADPIHVIAFTADILPKAKRDCMEAGMNDYLSKPIKVRDLANALLRCH